MKIIQNRRTFLTGLSAAGSAGLFKVPSIAAGEPPPETTTIRLPMPSAACLAPLSLAEELLHEEGFTDVRYVPSSMTAAAMVPDGVVDLDMQSWSDYLPLVDAGRPLTVLAGIQVGCMELRANDSIRSVADLRGKRVGVNAIGATDHMLVSMMAAYVGLKPASDINWVVNPTATQAELFTSGEVDAFIGFPPEPKKPCPRDVGHVIVNITNDRPWSNYFCCMAVANTDFIRSNPLATKRALRALLKATDICHQQPERAAQWMADVGFSHECAMMTMKDTRYDLWREYDPEDTVRFFALRLNELGMIKKTPNEVISGFTDWHFFREIKRELKM
ncbi:ABC transporter substrate-binding protein [Mesorhizobium ventifaucium]|uniref:NMT1 domain-containing protein n=1 Tax=Mesorhizobium ventifaucium TaxID=666020 RepID=A0ABN8JIL8_9HYPH|nr:ABC transporter substrate-binding protein [Mesorhizobium ventifaucium]CAH2395781.1 NMT1 domain-containing protein [Mesorhizobium ventifaucium]